MNGLNKAILIGEVSDPPKLKTLPNGKVHLSLRLHTAEVFPDENGIPRERKAWHTVVVWGHRGEALAPLLSRGKRLAVEGRIVHRQWDDLGGKRHNVTEIYADDIVLLGTRTMLGRPPRCRVRRRRGCA